MSELSEMRRGGGEGTDSTHRDLFALLNFVHQNGHIADTSKCPIPPTSLLPFRNTCSILPKQGSARILYVDVLHKALSTIST